MADLLAEFDDYHGGKLRAGERSLGGQEALNPFEDQITVESLQRSTTQVRNTCCHIITPLFLF